MRSWNDSSSSRIRRSGLAIVVSMIVGAGSSLRAETDAFDTVPATLAELLEGFARTTGLEARFEEEKYLSLLAVPLESRGRLYFAPPSTLLRRVESPRAQDVLVVDDRVRILDASGEQTIDLASRSEVRPLVESMLWIFTGNLEALERAYRVDYEVLEAEPDGTRRWVLNLVPRADPLAQLVNALRVSGRGRLAETLELREKGGDRTLTRILEANPLREFTSEERQELFGRGS